MDFKFSDVKVGADPEVFFVDKQGLPHSAEGLVGGSKKEPKEIFVNVMKGFAVQEDNVSAEFNIPAAGSAKDFSNHINRVIKYLDRVAAHHKYTLAYQSAMHFSAKDLNTKHAQTLGCEPDYNVWTRDENPRPKPPRSLRTAAGHVHIGWDNPDNNEREAVLKGMDLFLGVPSIVCTRKNERRELYGKAGACRMKPYGAEYRTLDNFWIASRENREYVFSQTVGVIEHINGMGKDNFTEMLDEFGETIQDTINNHNQDRALGLCNKFNIPLFPVFAL